MQPAAQNPYARMCGRCLADSDKLCCTQSQQSARGRRLGWDDFSLTEDQRLGRKAKTNVYVSCASSSDEAASVRRYELYAKRLREQKELFREQKERKERIRVEKERRERIRVEKERRERFRAEKETERIRAEKERDERIRAEKERTEHQSPELRQNLIAGAIAAIKVAKQEWSMTDQEIRSYLVEERGLTDAEVNVARNGHAVGNDDVSRSSSTSSPDDQNPRRHQAPKPQRAQKPVHFEIGARVYVLSHLSRSWVPGTVKKIHNYKNGQHYEVILDNSGGVPLTVPASKKRIRAKKPSAKVHPFTSLGKFSYELTSD